MVQLVFAVAAFLFNFLAQLLGLFAVAQHGATDALHAQEGLLVGRFLLGVNFLQRGHRCHQAADHRRQIGDYQNGAYPHEERNDEGGGGAVGESGNKKPDGKESEM